MHRRLGLTCACLLAAAGVFGAPARAAAADGLIITSQATYEVRPDDRAVAVTVVLSATNVTPDTSSGRTYYTGITLPIPAGAAGVTASAGGIALPVTVSGDTTTDLADIGFGVDLFYQQTYQFTLRFSILDRGGDPDRETRIGTSFVSLPVWAYGSSGTAGSSVEVVVPAGYDVAVPLGEMEILERADGTHVVAADIADAGSFFAYVSAERAAGRDRHRLELRFAEGPATVLLLGWPDDPEWSERQARFLSAGLPRLEEAIGIPYPIIGVLNVTEHAYQHLGDYAGFFLPGDDTIEMRFDADAFTALHEAAHIWLNGSLIDERWILEGFASYYAEEVGSTLGEDMTADELTPELEGAAFPLNTWGGVGAEDATREEFGYAASLAVAREIAALAGESGLRAVWRAADAGRLAYAEGPADLVRRGDARPDGWQRFLDLLENETDVDFDPIWERWVVTGVEGQQLAAREAARETYATTLEALGAWEMPRSTRLLMETWRFTDASAELSAIDELLDGWQRLAGRSAALTLEPSSGVAERLGTDGLDAATSELERQSAAVAALESATAALAGERELIEEIGLLGGPDPAVDLQAARAAFEAGDAAVAEDRAERAGAADATAAGRGRARVAIVGGGVLALDLGAMATLAAVRRRAARRRAARTGAPRDEAA